MAELPRSEGDQHEAPDAPAHREPYESPRIIWSEPYAPTTFGVSCAKQIGACAPFPTSA
jgi:hypothetical protein